MLSGHDTKGDLKDHNDIPTICNVTLLPWVGFPDCVWAEVVMALPERLITNTIFLILKYLFNIKSHLLSTAKMVLPQF